MPCGFLLWGLDWSVWILIYNKILCQNQQYTNKTSSASASFWQFTVLYYWWSGLFHFKDEIFTILVCNRIHREYLFPQQEHFCKTEAGFSFFLVFVIKDWLSLLEGLKWWKESFPIIFFILLFNTYLLTTSKEAHLLPYLSTFLYSLHHCYKS